MTNYNTNEADKAKEATKYSEFADDLGGLAYELNDMEDLLMCIRHEVKEAHPGLAKMFEQLEADLGAMAIEIAKYSIALSRNATTYQAFENANVDTLLDSVDSLGVIYPKVLGNYTFSEYLRELYKNEVYQGDFDANTPCIAGYLTRLVYHDTQKYKNQEPSILGRLRKNYAEEKKQDNN